MKTISLKSRVSTDEKGGKFGTWTTIRPFVMARQYTPVEGSSLSNWKDVPFWLEYSPNKSPTEQEIENQPEIPEVQTLNSYEQLPMERSVSIFHYRAICERIAGGIVGIVELGGGGCLWTMLPPGTPEPS